MSLTRVSPVMLDEDLSASPFVIFSTGQSNMPSTVPYIWDAPDNLFVWNFDGNTQDASAVGTAFVRADGTVIGPSVAAGAAIARENPLRKVYVINVARGGMGLVNWGSTPPAAPDGYNFRQAITGNVPFALASIGLDRIDAFVFGGAEADANSQSQTISLDFETNIMIWLNTQSWFKVATPTYIMGMSPYAQSAPDNGDYLWRRYNGSLKQAVATDPGARFYIDIDDFPITLFNGPTGLAGDIPYIHRTAEGYYQCGMKLGRAMLGGMRESILRADNLEGIYVPSFGSGVNCSVVNGYSYWYRVGNTINVVSRLAVTVATAGQATSFSISVPIKAKSFPNNVAGVLGSPNSDAGMVSALASTQTVQASFVAKSSGTVAICVQFSYRVNSSDQLPNSPAGTT